MSDYVSFHDLAAYMRRIRAPSLEMRNEMDLINSCIDEFSKKGKRYRELVFAVRRLIVYNGGIVPPAVEPPGYRPLPDVDLPCWRTSPIRSHVRTTVVYDDTPETIPETTGRPVHRVDDIVWRTQVFEEPVPFRKTLVPPVWHDGGLVSVDLLPHVVADLMLMPNTVLSGGTVIQMIQGQPVGTRDFDLYTVMSEDERAAFNIKMRGLGFFTYHAAYHENYISKYKKDWTKWWLLAKVPAEMLLEYGVDPSEVREIAQRNIDVVALKDFIQRFRKDASVTPDEMLSSLSNIKFFSKTQQAELGVDDVFMEQLAKGPKWIRQLFDRAGFVGSYGGYVDQFFTRRRRCPKSEGMMPFQCIPSTANYTRGQCVHCREKVPPVEMAIDVIYCDKLTPAEFIEREFDFDHVKNYAVREDSNLHIFSMYPDSVRSQTFKLDFHPLMTINQHKQQTTLKRIKKYSERGFNYIDCPKPDEWKNFKYFASAMFVNPMFLMRRLTQFEISMFRLAFAFEIVGDSAIPFPVPDERNMEILRRVYMPLFYSIAFHYRHSIEEGSQLIDHLCEALDVDVWSILLKYLACTQTLKDLIERGHHEQIIGPVLTHVSRLITVPHCGEYIRAPYAPMCKRMIERYIETGKLFSAYTEMYDGFRHRTRTTRSLSDEVMNGVIPLPIRR